MVVGLRQFTIGRSFVRPIGFGQAVGLRGGPQNRFPLPPKTLYGAARFRHGEVDNLLNIKGLAG